MTIDTANIRAAVEASKKAGWPGEGLALVTELCNEIERLRHENGTPLSMLGVDQLRQENDDLRREIERLRKDAERYRWLVEYLVSDRTDQDEAIVAASAIGVDYVTAVIDAAMEHKT